MDDDQRRTSEDLEDDDIDVEAHRKTVANAAEEADEAEEPDFELHRKSNIV
ncbi:MAG TPA: hypothetical protein VGJ25_11065 [Gaiellaceae bacterium]